MKKFLSLALSIAMLLSITAGLNLTAYAGDLQSDKFEYQLLEDGTAEITGYLGTEEYLEIPSELNGTAVTSIADGAFIEANDIVIPDSITKIGTYAISDCNRISFGNTVKTAGIYAIKCGSNLGLCVNYNGSYDDWMNIDVYNGLYNVDMSNPSLYDSAQFFVVATSGYRLNLNGKLLTEIDYNFEMNYITRFFSCDSIERIVIPESVESFNEMSNMFGLSSAANRIYDVWILNPNTVFEGFFYHTTNIRFVGYAGSTAEKCSKEYDIPFVAISDAIVDMEYSGASVTLQDDLSLNFKAPKSAVDGVLAEENVSAVYATFEVNGKETKVDMPTVSGESYSFTCPDIAPNMMNDVVNAKLYATIDGADVCVDTASYSVADYCYAMLDKTDDAELKALLVDMLNYGADSQAYTSYETNKLANSSLTDEQKSFGTAENPILNSTLDTEYEAIDNPSAEWLGAGLLLDENISMRFKLSADDTTNLSVKVTSESGEWTIPSAEFVPTNGGYYVYFNGFNAGQLSEAVYVTVYDGNTAVSNTLRYSIETYAAMAQSTDNEALKSLTNSMMKYGNSAYAYIH